eukprot:gene7025-4983_t
MEAIGAFPEFVRASTDAAPLPGDENQYPALPSLLEMVVAAGGQLGLVPQRVAPKRQKQRITSLDGEADQDGDGEGGDDPEEGVLVTRTTWVPSTFCMEHYFRKPFIQEWMALHGVRGSCGPRLRFDAFLSTRLAPPPVLRLEDIRLPLVIERSLRRKLAEGRAGGDGGFHPSPLLSYDEEREENARLAALQALVLDGQNDSTAQADGADQDDTTADPSGLRRDDTHMFQDGSAGESNAAAGGGLMGLQHFALPTLLLGNHTLLHGPPRSGKRVAVYLGACLNLLARACKDSADTAAEKDYEAQNNKESSAPPATTAAADPLPQALLLFSGYSDILQFVHWSTDVFGRDAFEFLHIDRDTGCIAPLKLQQDSENQTVSLPGEHHSPARGAGLWGGYPMPEQVQGLLPTPFAGAPLPAPLPSMEELMQPAVGQSLPSTAREAVADAPSSNPALCKASTDGRAADAPDTDLLQRLRALVGVDLPDAPAPAPQQIEEPNQASISSSSSFSVTEKSHRHRHRRSPRREKEEKGRRRHASGAISRSGERQHSSSRRGHRDAHRSSRHRDHHRRRSDSYERDRHRHRHRHRRGHSEDKTLNDIEKGGEPQEKGEAGEQQKLETTSEEKARTALRGHATSSRHRHHSSRSSSSEGRRSSRDRRRRHHRRDSHGHGDASKRHREEDDEDRHRRRRRRNINEDVPPIATADPQPSSAISTPSPPSSTLPPPSVDISALAALDVHSNPVDASSTVPQLLAEMETPVDMRWLQPSSSLPSYLTRRIPVLLLTYHGLREALESSGSGGGGMITSVALPLERVGLFAVMEADKVLRPPLRDSLTASHWVSVMNAMDVDCQVVVTTRSQLEDVHSLMVSAFVPDCKEEDLWCWSLEDQAIWRFLQVDVEPVNVQPTGGEDGHEGRAAPPGELDAFGRPHGGGGPRVTGVDIDTAKLLHTAGLVLQHFRERSEGWQGPAVVVVCGSRREQETVAQHLGKILLESQSRSAAPERRHDEDEEEHTPSHAGAGLLRLTTVPEAFGRGHAEILVLTDTQLHDPREQRTLTQLVSPNVRLLLHYSIPKGALMGSEEGLREVLATRARRLLGSTAQLWRRLRLPSTDAAGRELMECIPCRVLLTEHQLKGRVGEKMEHLLDFCSTVRGGRGVERRCRRESHTSIPRPLPSRRFLFLSLGGVFDPSPSHADTFYSRANISSMRSIFDSYFLQRLCMESQEHAALQLQQDLRPAKEEVQQTKAKRLQPAPQQLGTPKRLVAAHRRRQLADVQHNEGFLSAVLAAPLTELVLNMWLDPEPTPSEIESREGVYVCVWQRCRLLSRTVMLCLYCEAYAFPIFVVCLFCFLGGFGRHSKWPRGSRSLSPAAPPPTFGSTTVTTPSAPDLKERETSQACSGGHDETRRVSAPPYPASFFSPSFLGRFPVPPDHATASSHPPLHVPAAVRLAFDAACGIGVIVVASPPPQLPAAPGPVAASEDDDQIKASQTEDDECTLWICYQTAAELTTRLSDRYPALQIPVELVFQRVMSLVEKQQRILSPTDGCLRFVVPAAALPRSASDTPLGPQQLSAERRKRSRESCVEDGAAPATPPGTALLPQQVTLLCVLELEVWKECFVSLEIPLHCVESHTALAPLAAAKALGRDNWRREGEDQPPSTALESSCHAPSPLAGTETERLWLALLHHQLRHAVLYRPLTSYVATLSEAVDLLCRVASPNVKGPFAPATAGAMAGAMPGAPLPETVAHQLLRQFIQRRAEELVEQDPIYRAASSTSSSADTAMPGTPLTDAGDTNECWSREELVQYQRQETGRRLYSAAALTRLQPSMAAFHHTLTVPLKRYAQSLDTNSTAHGAEQNRTPAAASYSSATGVAPPQRLHKAVEEEADRALRRYLQQQQRQQRQSSRSNTPPPCLSPVRMTRLCVAEWRTGRELTRTQHTGWEGYDERQDKRYAVMCLPIRLAVSPGSLTPQEQFHHTPVNAYVCLFMKELTSLRARYFCLVGQVRRQQRQQKQQHRKMNRTTLRLSGDHF